jgi:hypothetical protein
MATDFLSIAEAEDVESVIAARSLADIAPQTTSLLDDLVCSREQPEGRWAKQRR